MSRAIVLTIVSCGVVVYAATQRVPPDTEMRVRLLSPLKTETSRPGDTFSAQVLEPEEFANDTVEGEVKESKSGGKISGKSVLNFSFSKLIHRGETIPISASVKSVVNSQGKENVDEEGRILRKKNNVKNAAVGAGLGALFGALAAGGKGAAIGAGVGAAAGLIFTQVTAEGANVSLDAGSEFVLSAREVEGRRMQ